MKAKEIYEAVLTEVCDITGIDKDDIRTSGREECADARFLLVKAMSKMMSDGEIGKLIGRTRRGVAWIRSCEGKMRKWIVGRNWEEIRKRLGSNGFSL